MENPPASAGDLGSVAGSGRSPGGGHGTPLQYSGFFFYKQDFSKRELIGYETNLVSKEGIINNYTGTAGINWDCPGQTIHLLTC